MNLGDDGRAQSTLVGAILLFAILIIAFSSYQAFVVPNQNAEVEFNHNSEVQTDMQDLRNSLLDVRSVERIDEGEYEIVSEHRPVRVRVGTQYPARLVALNPPTPTGELRTSDPEIDFTIEGAEVTNPDAYEGDPQGLLDDFEDEGFETRFLSYRPSYNEYRQAPRTGLEHSLLYNEFENTDLSVKNQRLINEKRLNVVLFGGNISPASGQAVTLDPETLDGPTAPISIEASNDNIEFIIPTNRPMLWADDDVIGEEFGVGATHARVVGDPDPEDNQITIELEAGETYQLRAMRVGFDGGSEENQFTPVQLAESEPMGGKGDELLPGPRVFNAQEDADEPLQEGDTFDLTADVSSVGQTGEDNWRGGTTIQAAEWYVQGDDPGEGNANPMEAVDGEYLNDVEVEVEDEVSANELEEGENTIIIRGQDSRGIWGEDTDNVSVVVGEVQDESRFTTLIAETNAVGGGGNSISEVEFEWVASNNPDSVTFEVENTQEDQTSSETFTGAAAGSGDVTIDGFGSPNRNNVEITATVQKGGLTETCSIVDLDSGQTYNKADGDFDCNT